MPHVLQLGGTYSLLDKKLLLASEVALSFYGESNESQMQTFETGFQGAVPRENSIEFNWEHTVQLKAGGEFLVTPNLALRLGYSVGNSATPEKGANPFVPPPGLMQAVTTGAGLRMSRVEVDVGGGMLLAGADVDSAEMGSPGHYGADAWLLAIAATYRQ
jgi:long-subunit fatty acid transport protein